MVLHVITTIPICWYCTVMGDGWMGMGAGFGVKWLQLWWMDQFQGRGRWTDWGGPGGGPRRTNAQATAVHACTHRHPTSVCSRLQQRESARTLPRAMPG